MATYIGLCIGGPKAGQSVSHPDQCLKVMEMTHHPQEPILHVYNWTHIGPFAIWIHSSLDLNQALNDMAVAYSEKHHGK